MESRVVWEREISAEGVCCDNPDEWLPHNGFQYMHCTFQKFIVQPVDASTYCRMNG